MHEIYNRLNIVVNNFLVEYYINEFTSNKISCRFEDHELGTVLRCGKTVYAMPGSYEINDVEVPEILIAGEILDHLKAVDITALMEAKLEEQARYKRKWFTVSRALSEVAENLSILLGVAFSIIVGVSRDYEDDFTFKVGRTIELGFLLPYDLSYYTVFVGKESSADTIMSICRYLCRDITSFEIYKELKNDNIHRRDAIKLLEARLFVRAYLSSILSALDALHYLDWY